MAQEQAIKRAREQKQGGAIAPLIVGLSKCHNFSNINDEKNNEEDTPQLFIAM